jgi:2-oxo-4-hydroxy-4-carboxy-5-ureidoimidazoline decarboxylase
MSQQNPVNDTLENWNRLEQPDAMKAILPCNGSTAWAIGMVNARSFETPEQCFAASDTVWASLTPKDWQQAFDSHPRLGQSKARHATAQSLAWSGGEQSDVSADAAADTATQTELAAANQAYEQKFGRIFILCATGKSAADVLAAIQQRMRNDPAVEFAIAGEQQRQITQLRLHKWLGMA